MDECVAISALAALSQNTRLETFGLLVKHKHEGVPAGELARLRSVPQKTMSALLATLIRAVSIIGERQSLSIIYRANLVHLTELVLFLLNNCCGGHADVCAPLVESLKSCRPTKVKTNV